VVDGVVENVTTHEGFKSLSNDRLATVDQLWVYQLLSEFSSSVARDPRRLLSRVALVIMGSVAGKVWVVAALLALGTSASALGLGTASLWTRALGVVLGGLFVGLLSAALWAWWTERQ
jgi:hypothetical protein